MYSATNFSNLPSRLSVPGGVSLFRDSNNIFTSPTPTLQNSKLQSLSFIIWSVMHEYKGSAFVAHMSCLSLQILSTKNYIQVVGNIKGFCYEQAIYLNEG
jgi:hypothetical protein